MDLNGKVAIVTGGNGGLGRHIAAALAGAGCRVAVVCRTSLTEAQAVAEPLGGRAYAFDCADGADIRRLHEAVLADLGGVDVLVNNAGINEYIAFDDLDGMTLEWWNDIIRVNQTGPFLLSRELAPSLKAGDGGRIINISSIAGFAPVGSSIAYSVAKAGLNHLTRCLAVALAPDVLVNTVAPGHMPGTRMTERLPPERRARSVSSALLARATDRDDVAAQVVAFARSDSTTGQALCVDAGRVLH